MCYDSEAGTVGASSHRNSIDMVMGGEELSALTIIQKNALTCESRFHGVKEISEFDPLLEVLMAPNWSHARSVRDQTFNIKAFFTQWLKTSKRRNKSKKHSSNQSQRTPQICQQLDRIIIRYIFIIYINYSYLALLLLLYHLKLNYYATTIWNNTSFFLY